MYPDDFGGQRLKVKVAMDIYGNNVANKMETTSNIIVCIFIKPGKHVNYEWWEDDPYWLWKSKVKGQGQNINMI